MAHEVHFLAQFAHSLSSNRQPSSIEKPTAS
jgi:hypothetical protein